MSVELKELLESKLVGAIASHAGGGYELPDGRSFWLDSVAANAIARRVIAGIISEVKDVSSTDTAQ